MSLIGQLPLAAIRFYCKNMKDSVAFYKEVIGLKQVETRDIKDDNAYFDLGNILLALRPKTQSRGVDSQKQTPPDNFVFLVENSIEVVQSELVKRGAKMKSKRIVQDSNGKTAWFADPDGHVIYLWQPPRRDSKKFKEVEPVVGH